MAPDKHRQSHRPEREEQTLLTRCFIEISLALERRNVAVVVILASVRPSSVDLRPAWS